MAIKFSSDLKYALEALSNSIAPDMCEGGDDAEAVAEMTLTALDVHGYVAERKEVIQLVESEGYTKVLAEAARHVATL